jgi:hypothetical protein
MESKPIIIVAVGALVADLFSCLVLREERSQETLWFVWFEKVLTAHCLHVV